MLWLLDPALAEEGSTRLADLGLNAWMGRYGLSLADDVVLDPSSEVAFFGPGTIYTVGYGEHVIVEPLEQTNTPVLFPGARSIAPSHDAPEGVEITPLVATTDEGWGETRLDAHDPVYDAGEDVAGPVTLAVAVRLTRSAEADTAGPEGRLVVVGDSDFATDSSIQSAANSLLTLNIFNWLVEREQLIAIEPRRPEETHLSLSDGEMLGLLGLVLGLLPGLAILAGITVFLQRRR